MISDAAVLLWGVASLLGTAVLAIAVSRTPGSGTRLVYGLTLGISAAALLVLAGRILEDPVTPSTAVDWSSTGLSIPRTLSRFAGHPIAVSQTAIVRYCWG